MNKATWCGEERQPTQSPLNVVFEVMSVENCGQALLQLIRRRFRAESEIEIHDTLAGDHVACSSAGMDVAHLPTGRREELIAVVPFDRDQFGQCGSQRVNRIFRKLRVCDVALYSFDGELSAHRASAAIFNHVACSLD